MAKKFSLDNASPYPHILVTGDTFPRFLATRTLDDNDADYFGAFLTKTSVRILIDFLNRTFRLRSCDVEIDGSFSVPCTQYFRKRCLAPCVRDLCGVEHHGNAADAMRLFLQNDRVAFEKYVLRLVEQSSELLNFERAAFWRDALSEVASFWQNPRWKIWLDDAVDTYDLKRDENQTHIFLITTRGRQTLGKAVFVVDYTLLEDVESVLLDIIDQLYLYYAPREIRVGIDFGGRKELAKRLSKRFGREIKIVVVSNDNATQTALRAIAKSRADIEIEQARDRLGEKNAALQIQRDFGLRRLPERIEAVDVSHISGTGLVGAASVWSRGTFLKKEYGFSMSDSSNELSAIGSFVIDRYAGENLPDLVLIDGGRSQLYAVIKVAEALPKMPTFISAVKPPGKHSKIAHFLTEKGTRAEFNAQNAGHLLLQELRDDAHELANWVHREYRDARHFYEATGTKPLVVPIRFTTADGSADDLRPIETKNRASEPKKRMKSKSTGLYRPLRRAR